jgi:hypothetical protein
MKVVSVSRSGSATRMNVSNPRPTQKIGQYIRQVLRRTDNRVVHIARRWRMSAEHTLDVVDPFDVSRVASCFLRRDVDRVVARNGFSWRLVRHKLRYSAVIHAAGQTPTHEACSLRSGRDRVQGLRPRDAHRAACSTARRSAALPSPIHFASITATASSSAARLCAGVHNGAPIACAAGREIHRRRCPSRAAAIEEVEGGRCLREHGG